MYVLCLSVKGLSLSSLNISLTKLYDGLAAVAHPRLKHPVHDQKPLAGGPSLNSSNTENEIKMR